jgi:hypothetical protein
MPGAIAMPAAGDYHSQSRSSPQGNQNASEEPALLQAELAIDIEQAIETALTERERQAVIASVVEAEDDKESGEQETRGGGAIGKYCGSKSSTLIFLAGIVFAVVVGTIVVLTMQRASPSSTPAPSSAPITTTAPDGVDGNSDGSSSPATAPPAGFDDGSDSLADGSITFYEGNSGTQNVVCILKSYIDQTISGGTCEHDEARSLKLTDVEQGTKIWLYDDPDCTTADDYCEITVRRDIASYTVDSFELWYDDDYIRVRWYQDNGLDGKVSCIEIKAA